MYITPTDLHHSRYASSSRGIGIYVACSKQAISLLKGKGRHRAIFPGAEVHDSLEDRITAGLQARCAEEAELLANHIRSTPLRRDAPVELAVRRLTTTEYDVASKEGIVSDSNISAVLVIPKPDEPFECGTLQKPSLLLRGSSSSNHHSSSNLSAPRIPMFFGPSLVQDILLQARLRKALDRVLSAERNALRNARPHMPAVQAFADLPYEPKAQDAYALCPSRRGDVVPLVVALWRLKTWEDSAL
jgi:hypothetical protein